MLLENLKPAKLPVAVLHAPTSGRKFRYIFAGTDVSQKIFVLVPLFRSTGCFPLAQLTLPLF